MLGKSQSLGWFSSVTKSVHLLGHASLSLSLCLSVFLSVHVYQHGSHWTDFFLNWFCFSLQKPVEKWCVFFFKLANKVGKFTQRPKWFQIVHYISIYVVCRQLLPVYSSKSWTNTPLFLYMQYLVLLQFFTFTK